MVSFPILKSVYITEFGMYPGTEKTPGLHIDFHPGLTLILGANGLGKTTLVTMLFRAMTGPYELPSTALTGTLGNSKLQANLLPYAARRIFANRVKDGAKDSKILLVFQLNKSVISVERSCVDLRITKLVIDETEFEDADEEMYQQKICQLSSVSSFGDWILLLRYMVFYFEDRRGLVWDQSAQRQILRILFMTPEISETWLQKEREILELDSRMRNLNSAVNREEVAFRTVSTKSITADDVLAELRPLEKLQESDLNFRETLNEQNLGFETLRERSRLSYLQREQERESIYREYEHAKLTAIASRFPDRSETARYIFAQMMVEGSCLVCGSTVPAVAEELNKRIDESRCVVCSTNLEKVEKFDESTLLADKRVAVTSEKLFDADEALASAKQANEKSQIEYNAYIEKIVTLNVRIAERSERISMLVKRLPAENADLHKQESELSSLRVRVANQRQQLQQLQNSFRSFVAERNAEIALIAEELSTSFQIFATGFLLEDCRLTWSPQKGKLGEYGEPYDFPSFEMDLSGADFPSPVRRSGPEQVSESQREFIDLSFKMALSAISGVEGHSSLIIDAPESSLDAVFVERAANVLIKFAEKSSENRLVITSNLVEGSLLPRLIESAVNEGDGQKRVINLFKIATPTAAIRELREEYDTRLKLLFSKITTNDNT